MEKLILLFISFVSISSYSYSQPNKPIVSEGLFTKVADYAELIVNSPNRNLDSFKGYLEYSTDTHPIQGTKCQRGICEYPMNVTKFIKEMESNGWTLVSSSVATRQDLSYSQYLFRKE